MMSLFFRLSRRFFAVLLRNGADPSLKNSDGKTALDVADIHAKAVLLGQWSIVMIRRFALI